MTEKCNKNIALVELGGSHTECMHLQIKALKNKGYNVFLICNTFLLNDFPEKDFLAGYQLHDMNSSIKKQVATVLRIRKFIRENNIQSIVFNTTEITIVRNLLILRLPKIKNYIGIVHNAKYLESSTTFKFLSRKIKKYFVLSEDVVKTLKPQGNIKVAAFYPIYYPQCPTYKLEKPENEFWICVPGSMSPKRKDLASLLNALKQTQINRNVRIVLLGTVPPDEYPEFTSDIRSLSQSNKIELFTTRIANDVFAAYMKRSDIVMPLIHPDGKTDFYGKYRISGAYNLAFGYKIPLLLENSLSTFSDFKGVALFYDKTHIVEQINKLADNNEDFINCKNNLLQHPVYNVETQYERYVDFIEQ